MKTYTLIILLFISFVSLNAIERKIYSSDKTIESIYEEQPGGQWGWTLKFHLDRPAPDLHLYLRASHHNMVNGKYFPETKELVLVLMDEFSFEHRLYHLDDDKHWRLVKESRFYISDAGLQGGSGMVKYDPYNVLMQIESPEDVSVTYMESEEFKSSTNRRARLQNYVYKERPPEKFSFKADGDITRNGKKYDITQRPESATTAP